MVSARIDLKTGWRHPNCPNDGDESGLFAGADFINLLWNPEPIATSHKLGNAGDAKEH